jgi:hypothetical protein
MDYNTILNNETIISRPFLTASQADEEIYPAELQEAFAKLARGK